ncbi:MAG: DUF2059 domain-containing protein [Sphingomonas sp.]|nr:DUF2059 domain-containing protein [Sphingomonas sp.]
MKMMIFTTALLCAVPALARAPAKTPPPAPPIIAAPSQAPAAKPDDTRLALARSAVAHVWPAGTYQKMMSSMMIDQMMGAVFDTKLGDMVPNDPKMSDEDKKVAETTMGDAIALKDPHFRERMRLTNATMVAEMGPMLNRVEPKIRDALAMAYAKKFNVQQLTEINRFFATPPGQFYASESMLLFMDPEMMKAMMGMMPELIKTMPAIMEKVKAATAHLPEPPKDDKEDDEAEEVADTPS